MGVKMDILEVEACETSSYFFGGDYQRQGENSLAFLAELDKKCTVTTLPLIVGGD
jgi:hypothetical protein